MLRYDTTLKDEKKKIGINSLSTLREKNLSFSIQLNGLIHYNIYIYNFSQALAEFCLCTYLGTAKHTLS